VDLLIFPFNGNGIEALDALGTDFNLLGFVDDLKQGQDFFGIPILGREAFQKYNHAKVLAVPGSPVSYKNRKNIIDGLGIELDRFTRVIHPQAHVSKYAKLGINILVLSGSSINASAEVENHVIILNNSIIHHDSKINEYSIIGSSVVVAGNTLVEENCYLGSASSIINNIIISEGTLIGLGSNVIRSVPENSKFIGNPAKQIH
jgi:sugar O-acyltransferase (sialic acid O-acetyltransferase NeuD family)